MVADRQATRTAGPLSVAATTAVGLAALAVGAGIAVPHAAAGAWSVLSIGAVLLTLAGAALLVRAGVVAGRGRRWWVRALFGVVLLAAAYGVGMPVGFAVAVTVVPRAPVGTEAPADRGLGGVEASFDTADGVTLAAWYLPSRNGAAVVAMPGASSARSAVLDQAVVLARHGYGVLLVDPRGMGRSGGRAMNYGWFGDQDVMAAVTHLLTRDDVRPDRIAVLGESMGGEQAIGAIGADPRIRAVVAEGATHRVAEDTVWLGEVYGLRGSAQHQVDRLTELMMGLLTAAPSPPALFRSAAAAAPRPILLLAAGAVADEVSAGTHQQAAAAAAAPPGNVTLWVVPDAAHTGGLRARPQDWEERVVGFLDQALLDGGASPSAGGS